MYRTDKATKKKAIVKSQDKVFENSMKVQLWHLGGVSLPFYLYYLRYLNINDREKEEIKTILRFRKDCLHHRFAVAYLINWPSLSN